MPSPMSGPILPLSPALELAHPWCPRLCAGSVAITDIDDAYGTGTGTLTSRALPVDLISNGLTPSRMQLEEKAMRVRRNASPEEHAASDTYFFFITSTRFSLQNMFRSPLLLLKAGMCFASTVESGCVALPPSPPPPPPWRWFCWLPLRGPPLPPLCRRGDRGGSLRSQELLSRGGALGMGIFRRRQLYVHWPSIQRDSVELLNRLDGVRAALKHHVCNAQTPYRPVVVHRGVLQRVKVRKQFVDVRFGHSKVQVRNHQLGAAESSCSIAAATTTQNGRGQQPVLVGSFVHFVLPGAVDVPPRKFQPLDAAAVVFLEDCTAAAVSTFTSGAILTKSAATGTDPMAATSTGTTSAGFVTTCYSYSIARSSSRVTYPIRF